MAYLMLYGNGWTQRWRIEDGKERQVQEDITRLGRSGTIQLPVLDPGTNSATTLVVSCALVAAAPDAGDRLANRPLVRAAVTTIKA